MSLYEDITFTVEFITDMLQRKIGLASHIYNGQWGVYVVDVSAQFWSTFELFCYCEAMPCKTWYVLWILLPHLCYLLKAFYRWFFPYSENIALLQSWLDGNTIHIKVTEMTLAQESPASSDDSGVNHLLMAKWGQHMGPKIKRPGLYPGQPHFQFTYWPWPRQTASVPSSLPVGLR